MWRQLDSLPENPIANRFFDALGQPFVLQAGPFW